MAGDAAIGEEVGRVGEDQVDGVVGDFFEDFEAVAVIQTDVVFGVVECDVLGEGVGSDIFHGRLQVEPAPGYRRMWCLGSSKAGVGRVAAGELEMGLDM